MKIGFFCNEYPPRPHGGIGTFVHMLAEALVAQGHTVTVAEWGSVRAERMAGGVRVVTLPQSHIPKVAWLANRLRLWRWLRGEVQAGRIELFEIPEYQGCLPFPFRACPIVVRLHLSQSHIEHLMRPHQVNRPNHWLEKATLFWHRRWIGVSRYILDETRRHFRLQPRQSAVIYNPAPAADPQTLPEPQDRPGRYVLYVGSVSERKGALLLANAMREIFAEFPDVHLVYVGAETEHNGAPIGRAIRHIIGDRYGDCVHFTGRLPHAQVLGWMKTAACLALPSRVESFGLVLLEAMALGVPVIYSAVGPGPELIEHGVDGLLVDPGTVGDLSNTLGFALQDKDAMRRMAERGRQKVLSQFTVEQCAAATFQFYAACHPAIR